MKRFLKTCIGGLLLVATSTFAQHRIPTIDIVGSDPIGTACTSDVIVQYNGNLYVCPHGGGTYAPMSAVADATARAAAAAAQSTANAAAPLAGATFTGAVNNTSTALSTWAGPINFAGGTMTGPLKLPTLEGALYADQWQNPKNTGNNGISLSLAECLTYSYACQVIAPALYAQTEAPPWGGFTAALTQAITTGPKSSDPLGCVIDNRYATPQLICNEGIGYNSRFNMAPWGIVQNALTMGAGGSPHNGALSVMNSQWMGAYDFSTGYGNGSESSVDGLSVLVNSYSPSIGSGISSKATHWAPGDVVVENLSAFGVGTTLGQNEGTEARLRIGEPGNLTQVTLSSAPTCGVTCTMSGTQTLGQAGAFGEELPWIDFPGYSTGYIASLSYSGGVNSVVGSTSTNWDSTFGVSNATTTTTATIGNPTSTNTFPQSNVTVAVASSSGFTTGTAFAFDAGSYKWEGFHITSIPDGTHIVVDSLNYPLLTGSTISQGGLAGYGFKMDADDVCGANGNGISTAGADSAIASGACIKSVYPIISNSAGNNLVLYTGSLAFSSNGPGGPTRGYSSMAGSGGSVTPTVSGGVVTSCTASGGSGYISSVGPSGYLTNPPQLSYSASPAWTTYPVLALTSVSSGALSGCTVISGGTQGGGGALSVSVTTSNPYHIYAQAESVQNYNAATGKMDASALVTMPLAGAFNSGDVIEQEHYFNWKTSGGAMNAVVNSWQHPGQKFARSLGLGGVWGTNDYADYINNSASPSVYYGSPISAPYTLGQGQLGTPFGYFLRGAFRSGLNMTLPPFSQQPSAVGAVVVNCAPYCSQWNGNYSVLTAENSNSSGNAEDVLQYNPVAQTWTFTAGATAYGGSGAPTKFSPATPTGPVWTSPTTSMDSGGNYYSVGGNIGNSYGGFGPSLQNLVEYSQFPSGSWYSPWAGYCGSTGTTLTANTSDVTDPNGGNTALKFASTAGQGCGGLSQGLDQQFATQPGNGSTVTASVYARALTGTVTGVVGIIDLTTSTTFIQSYTVGTAWTRMSIIKTITDSDTYGILVYTRQTGTTIYFAFAQAVVGGTPGIYVATTSAPFANTPGAVFGGSAVCTQATGCPGNSGAVTLYSTAGAALSGAHQIFFSGNLTAGSLALTLSGSAVFTSASTYDCSVHDTTTPGTAAYVSAFTDGSHFTITGTGTDAVRGTCTGN